MQKLEVLWNSNSVYYSYNSISWKQHSIGGPMFFEVTIWRSHAFVTKSEFYRYIFYRYDLKNSIAIESPKAFYAN